VDLPNFSSVNNLDRRVCALELSANTGSPFYELAVVKFSYTKYMSSVHRIGGLGQHYQNNPSQHLLSSRLGQHVKDFFKDSMLESIVKGL
jgi:hypothetical protein